MQPFQFLASTLAWAAILLSLSACQSGKGGTPTDPANPVAAASDSLSPMVVASDNGYLSGMLGAWSWVGDRTIPERGRLEPVRTTAQQGDLYNLSIRPFLKPGSLTLTGATPLADGTKYTLRFEHPFPLPADLARPATASKRLDLFLFDVQLLIARNGHDSFFGGQVTTDIDLIQDPDGFRRPGPIVNLLALGITSADTFPYRLLTLNDPADPRGNYDSIGWDGAEYLDARGFDVIPQGAIVTTSVIGPNLVPSDTKIILLAKYMDPRSGATPNAQRANRLPDPTDPTAFQYYLPEAAGDLQRIDITTDGSLLTEDNDEVAMLQLNILDWDHAAPIALTFPNPTKPREIRQPSAPISISASFPELSGTSFTGATDGDVTGLAGEWIGKSLAIRNVAQTLELPVGESQDVHGLVRILDQQDDVPDLILLNESLQPVTISGGYRPSTRYQRATVRVSSGKLPPTILSVDPTQGTPGGMLTLSATTKGPVPTQWSWNFGGGATPNVSIAANPEVILGAEGDYDATVTATNQYGMSEVFPFTLSIMLAPQITGVQPTGVLGWVGDLATFTVDAAGGPLTEYNWNFGGGTSPNSSTDSVPSVSLAQAGAFTGSVTVSNIFGTSTAFEFDYQVDPASAPVITGIAPTGTVGIEGANVQFESFASNTPTDWSWHFDGGATPNTSIAERPMVTLGDAGIYTGEVTVGNPFGEHSQEFSFEILPGPRVPTIQSVSPQGTLGLEGTVVSFSAIATELPTSWSWSFGGGATPNTSSAVSPSVTLGTPGTYNGTVTATNGNGSSTPFPFSYTVGAPPAPVIQSVTPTGVVDGEGGYHTFSALATNAPTEWLWTFGGGATPNFSSLATPLVQLLAPGTYTGTVMASNTGGASPVFQFEYTIDNRVTNWALTIGTANTSTNFGTELLAGASGEIYWLGEFTNEADFDPGANQHLGFHDDGTRNTFLLSLSPKAKYSWVQIYGESIGGHSTVDMEFSALDRIEVGGVFGENYIWFNSSTQPVGSGRDGLAADGKNAVWLNAFGTDGTYLDLAYDFGSRNPISGGNSVTSLQPISDGSLLVTAYNSGTGWWTVPGPSWNTSNYILKSTLDRQFVWVKQFSSYSLLRSAEAPNGDLILIGTFNSVVDFDPGPGTYMIDPGGLKQVAVTCLDATGNFRWASATSGIGTFVPQALEVDNGGAIHIAGNLTDTVDFDPSAAESPLDSQGSTDAVHWVLSGDGEFLQAQQIGAGAADTVDSLIFDAVGNIYLGGNFAGQVDFDPGVGSSQRLSSGGLDCYIVSLTSTGAFRWASSWGGPEDDDLNDIAVNGTRIMATGSFRKTADFDPGPGEVLRTANRATLPAAYLLTLKLDGTF